MTECVRFQPCDFNRAFLPPCAFSGHYVCPLPSPENHLDLAVTVGERLPLYIAPLPATPLDDEAH